MQNTIIFIVVGLMTVFLFEGWARYAETKQKMEYKLTKKDLLSSIREMELMSEKMSGLKMIEKILDAIDNAGYILITKPNYKLIKNKKNATQKKRVR